jgi:predicted PurR-regulated permease PerM
MSKRIPLLFLAALLLVLLPFVAQVAWPFLNPFLVAGILAVVIGPMNEKVMRGLKGRTRGTLVTTLVTILLLGVILVFAGFAVTRELAAVYDSLNRRSLDEGGWPALVTHTADRVVEALATRLPIDREEIRNELMERMKTATGFLLQQAGAAAGGLTSGIVNGLLTAVFLYVLLLHGEAWVARLRKAFPLDPEVTERLFTTVHRSVVANVSGVAAVALGQGVFLGIGFWFVGVRSPVLWGMIGGLASIIPVAGAPLVWVPAVVGFLVMGAYGKALILALWGSLIVGSIDNILRPFVVSGSGDKQHPLLVALAAIGGAYAFGMLGILLGPLVAALFLSIWDEFWRLLPGDGEQP